MIEKKNKPKKKKSTLFREALAYSEISLYPEKKATHITKEKIALDTLTRYTGSKPEEFKKYILLTNFPFYLDLFTKEMNGVEKEGSVLKVIHSETANISMIDYRVGAPMAALIIDVLSYIKPQVVIMLGLCGGLYPNQKVGDFFVPMAAIRDEGVSDHYMPKEVPSLPALMVQQYIAQTLMTRKQHFYTGVLHSTSYRMWEFDQAFREKLIRERATAIDMECSAIFTVGFAKRVPVGALMLISDLPMQKNGIKTKELANKVFEYYTHKHLEVGLEAIKFMQNISKNKNINFRRFQFI
jgi:AMP nucleosidase